MSYGSEAVEEFRRLTDEGKARQVEQALSSLAVTSWPEYDDGEREGVLTYVSEPRVSQAPDGLHEEHIWEVITNKFTVIGPHLGRMAIQSTENKPDSLTRILSIESGMRQPDIVSTKQLVTSIELSDVILFIKSHEFEVGRRSRLADLSPEEKTTIKLEHTELTRC